MCALRKEKKFQRETGSRQMNKSRQNRSFLFHFTVPILFRSESASKKINWKKNEKKMKKKKENVRRTLIQVQRWIVDPLAVQLLISMRLEVRGSGRQHPNERLQRSPINSHGFAFAHFAKDVFTSLLFLVLISFFFVFNFIHDLLFKTFFFFVFLLLFLVNYLNVVANLCVILENSENDIW